jgi:citrate lyase beta subunit
MAVAGPCLARGRDTVEDAVAPDAKETARVQIVEELQAGGYGNREIVVRYGCCPASVQQPRSVVVVQSVSCEMCALQ